MCIRDRYSALVFEVRIEYNNRRGEKIRFPMFVTKLFALQSRPFIKETVTNSYLLNNISQTYFCKTRLVLSTRKYVDKWLNKISLSIRKTAPKQTK